MHEMSLTESIVELIEEGRKQGFSRVRVVRLEIGALAQVEPEAMRFCFDAVTRGTLAEGARLDIASARGGLVPRLRKDRRDGRTFRRLPGMRRTSCADDGGRRNCASRNWRSNDVHGLRLRNGERRGAKPERRSEGRPRARRMHHDACACHDHGRRITIMHHGHAHDHDHSHDHHHHHAHEHGLRESRRSISARASQACMCPA